MSTNNVILGEVEPGDIFFVNPFDIEIGDEGKKNKQPADKIVEMAVSLYIYGQRKAVECRMTGDGNYALVHGLTRTRAARLMRAGFSYTDAQTGSEVRVKDRKFKVKVVLISTVKNAV